MNDYLPAINAVQPAMPEGFAYNIQSNLDTAERALVKIVQEAQAAIVALQEAKIAGREGNSAKANKYLGQALSVASHPGASGPIGSQWEKVVVALNVAQSDFRSGDAVASLLAEKAKA